MKPILKAILCVAALGVLAGAVVLIISGYVKSSVSDKILSTEEAGEIKDADCIIVLGCGMWEDEMSPMLSDRVETGIECYFAGAAPKLLMSGDHHREDYDEVNPMKNAAVEAGISSSDVFMDHAGLKTYDSMYRAKEVFGAKKVIIVTQKYHLYRSIYLAEKLGLEAYGVCADKRQYMYPLYNAMRESLARVKAFSYGIFKPLPEITGEKIPIFGDGNLTNDK